MKISFGLYSIIGQLMPGSVFLLAILFLFYGQSIDWSHPLNNLPQLPSLAIGFFTLLAWLVGLTLDVIRNAIIEPIWDYANKSGRDKKSGVHWQDIFFKADNNTVKNLLNHYYSYYVNNISIVLVAVLVMFVFLYQNKYPRVYVAIPTVLMIIYCRDAYLLRKELLSLTSEYLKKRQINLLFLIVK